MKIIIICLALVCFNDIGAMNENQNSPQTVVARLWHMALSRQCDKGSAGIDTLHNMPDLEEGIRLENYQPINIINSSDIEMSPVFNDGMHVDESSCCSSKLCRKTVKYSLFAAVGLSIGSVFGVTLFQYLLS